nr:flavin-dependent oxidoreductase [Jannaschia sp. Os4]
MIAGAGIGGLALGLTLHEIGVPFRIHERVRALRPLGVGINVQPDAVRELWAMGLRDALEAASVRTRDYGFHTRTGREIWTEPRGTWAGYAHPQYSIHRGRLQMILHDALIDRAGRDVLATGAPATGFDPDGTLHLGDRTATGDLVIGADGLHSAIRARMAPGEGAPVWSGRVLWRGTTQAPPFRTGASMVMAGNDDIRIVAYPITPPGAGGAATINWIAERTLGPMGGTREADWTRAVDPEDVAPHFEDWRFDWLDVPALIRGAAEVLEYPMVDRAPLARWTRGRATLLGDAAHPTYPVGSNGSAQAILDARVLGRCIRDHGPTPEALEAYEAIRRPRTTAIQRANRGRGPDAIMQMVEDRTGGDFDRMDELVPLRERAVHAERYKALAGTSIAALNAEPPILG